jgi:hypothetical protein
MDRQNYDEEQAVREATPSAWSRLSACLLGVPAGAVWLTVIAARGAWRWACRKIKAMTG